MSWFSRRVVEEYGLAGNGLQKNNKMAKMIDGGICGRRVKEMSSVLSLQGQMILTIQKGLPAPAPQGHLIRHCKWRRGCSCLRCGQVSAIPRETHLITKGLMKLIMGTKEEMAVRAKRGEEMVDHMVWASSSVTLGWFLKGFPAVYSLIQLSWLQPMKNQNCFLGN